MLIFVEPTDYMSTGYQIDDQLAVYYLTFQIVGRVDIFIQKVYQDIVIESLQSSQQQKGLDLIAFVIMSNHIHIIARSKTGDLSGTIRDFKNFTSQKFLEIVDSKTESRSDWMQMVFQYHGKFKNKDYKLFKAIKK